MRRWSKYFVLALIGSGTTCPGRWIAEPPASIEPIMKGNHSMHKTPQATEAAVVRLLLMDQHRKQVALCKHPDGLYWLLPCGMLPDHQTPLEYLDALAQESLPEEALAALSGQLEANKPVAWIYPSKELLPDTADVLQVVYLLTLAPEQLVGKSARALLYGEIVRFFPLDQLPDDLSPLDEVIIQTVRFAEARQALPIDMREARLAPAIPTYEIEGVSFTHQEPVLVIGGGEEAESVQKYAGRTGRIINITNTRPRWFILVLENGPQIVARPHHLKRASEPQAVAHTRTLSEASAITSPASARKAASTIQAVCIENWNGRAFNVYCKRDLAEEYGTRITRARMREGSLQVYGLDEGRWITNPAIVYQMI
jgi:hypothetical protein